MKTKTHLLLFCVVILFVLSACIASLAGDPLKGTSWALVSFGGTSPLPDTHPTLAFEDGQVKGNASCNSFGGEYKVKGDKMIFGDLYWTLMACMDNGVMDQEQAYMRMLTGEAEFELTEGQLKLTNQQGEVLIFEPMGGQD